MQQILVGSGGAVILPPPDSVSYSILSGGGSGNRSGDLCSGGAGAIPVQGTFAPIGGTSYAVTVGAGGIDSGAGEQSSIAGVGSASPGGGATSCNPGGSNQTYSGGSGSCNGTGGGGAGAGGNGTNGSSDCGGGSGGVGVVMPLSPTGLRVGGGGAGHGLNGRPQGTAVDGGGIKIVAGAPNRGGGGGNYAFGGSGRVIFRYSDSFGEASTTGSVDTSTSGGFRFYEFLSNGTISF